MTEAIHESRNVFADIGLPDAADHQLKADIVIEIKRVLEVRGLTQTAAAGLAGLAQPDLSNILRGRIKGFSVERLLRVLTALDQDVEIVVRPRSRDDLPAKVTVISAG